MRVIMRLSLFLPAIVCLMAIETASVPQALVKDDPRVVYDRLKRSTTIRQALDNFLQLVEPDSLEEMNHLPVVCHVVIDGSCVSDFCDCCCGTQSVFMVADRFPHSFSYSRLLGETYCRGYRVVFHSRVGRDLFPLHLQLSPSSYTEEYKHLSEPPLDELVGQSYGVSFEVQGDSLRFRYVMPRVKNDAYLWGIWDLLPERIKDTVDRN